MKMHLAAKKQLIYKTHKFPHVRLAILKQKNGAAWLADPIVYPKMMPIY